LFKVRADFVGPNSYDPKAERDALDQAVQQKATGILVGVTDPGCSKTASTRRSRPESPSITVDSDAPASKRLFFIGTNNYQVGMSGGLRLAQELKGKGNVVVFTMPDQHNMQDRLRGYRDALEHAGYQITRVVDIQGDPRIAFDTTTQIIGKEKDQVDAFVCLEAQSGKEVAGVLGSYQITGKVVMAMDTDPETLAWIQEGRHRRHHRAEALHHGIRGHADARQLVSPQAAGARYRLVEGQFFARSLPSWTLARRSSTRPM
jgi:ribose transport system substrate-binding protein